MPIYLDREELVLQLRANPADPEIFELYYCVSCRRFVAAGGLFPKLEMQPEHQGHNLAWLPGQDSFSGAAGHITNWLEIYQPEMSDARYRELRDYAHTTNSGNWAWLLKGPELSHWLAYLDTFLDRLAEEWLRSLNGLSSGHFPNPGEMWRITSPSGSPDRPQFAWKPGEKTQTESLFRLSNK